jgi:predicted membrane-bound dolichyl-phosphate-mannose-protein mannosyltransferase
MENLKKHAGLFVTIMLGAFFLLSLSLSWQESATYDEVAHIPSAYTYVDRSDMRLNTEHPPLLKDLAGFPLLFLDLDFPYDHLDWEKSGIHGQWSLGTEFLYKNGNDADQILFWSRLPIILVALLLGFLIYRWTKELAGTVAGLFALLLYVADPNIIAHSHYVTTDIGIAAALFASFYFFVQFLRNPSRGNILLAGTFLGIAELTKFSAVLLFPIFGLFAIAYGFTRPAGAITTMTERFWNVFRFVGKYIGVVGVAFALIWIVYAANTVTMPGEKLVEIADIKLGQPNAYAQFAHSLVETTSHSAFLKPLSTYFLGVGMVFERVGGGNNHYFLGEVSDDASPWYFPILFLLKETAPLLILLLGTVAYTVYRIGKSIEKTSTRSLSHLIAHSFQSHITQYLFGFFILFYAYISITGNLNIGFRHLFPIMPFLFVLIAKTTFDFIRRRNFQGERVSRIVLGFITLWIASITLLTYPSYLSYFNNGGGGTEQGYMTATDSNYDWGQDMKRLERWINNYNACVNKNRVMQDGIAGCDNPPSIIPTDTPIERINVDYFGGADPAYYLGEKYIPWYDQKSPEPGWYAISVLFYQESLYRANPEGKQTYEWLSVYPLVDRAGDSIFIFYIPSF